MIRFRDAMLLAGTKLRTRRIRTAITVLLSSALFAVIIAALILSNGAMKSLHDFNHKGLNDRFLVSASADPRLAGGILENNSLIELADSDYKQLVAKKTAEAKRLGVSYEPSSEPPAVMMHTTPGGLSSSKSINILSPAAQQALREYLHMHPGPGIYELKKVASAYHSIAFYTGTPVALFNGQIQTMENGKENFFDGKDFFYNTSATEMSGKLTDPFAEKGVDLHKGNVPLIVSYTRAEQLLGLNSLPKSASVHDQYERIKQLYDALHKDKMTIVTCYRNSVSEDQITTAEAQATDKNVRQDTSIHYALPSAASCGPAKVSQDNRSYIEKQQEIAERQFDAEFSDLPQAPQQQKITFQIVGLYSDIATNSNNLSFFSLLSNITGSSLDGGDVIPANMLTGIDAGVKQIIFGGKDQFGGIPHTYTVEFSSAQDAKQFVHDKSCTVRESGTCASPGKPFNLTAYGNNSIALAGINKKVTHWIAIAAIVIAIFAAVIMSTMVGRMIVDGRKESAVFRALGARRSDIVAIYITYTFVLTTLILIVSFGIGLIGALVISQYFGTHFTEQAQLLFGATNTDIRVRLFRPNMMQLGVVGVGVLAVGALSTIVPLLRNIRRNPIDDLREE